MLSPLPRSLRPSSPPPVCGGRALPLWPAGRCEIGVDRAMTLSSEDDQSPVRVFYSSKVVDDLTGFRASQTRPDHISLMGIGDFMRVAATRRRACGNSLVGTNKEDFPGGECKKISPQRVVHRGEKGSPGRRVSIGYWPPQPGKRKLPMRVWKGAVLTPMTPSTW